MSQTSAERVWNVGEILDWTIGHFRDRGFESPRLDAEVLLATVFGCKRFQLYTMFDAEVGPAERARYRDFVKRRAAGCPVAYLVGEKEFYSLPFAVDANVLIPRPETEHLVIAALDFAKPLESVRFLDVGTGSGAVAVSIANSIPAATGVALDVSNLALEVARSNAAKNGVAERIEFIESDLFAAVSEEAFDLIVSNPPYIRTEEIAKLAVDVRDHEPRLALDGGPDGLDVIRRIVAEAPPLLRVDGRLMIEIGFDQEQAVRSLFADQPEWNLLPTIRDYAGHPRVIAAAKRDG